MLFILVRLYWKLTLECMMVIYVLCICYITIILYISLWVNWRRSVGLGASVEFCSQAAQTKFTTT